ncbi:Bug family tripartite tricarboxylate transporter substrate binding protein [Siccirubricoccus deserti]
MDIFGRPLAERLGEALGQTVVFENKPGANGIVATHQVATARPDGEMLLFTTGSLIGNLAFSQQPLPYDPMKDVAPVSLVADGTGMMLVGRPDLPADMAGIAELARRKPGGLSCAITGFGNITHLAAEQFKEFTGAELLLVPLHGTGPSITEILAGNVDMTFSTVPPILPFIRDGKLRAIGYTGRRRALLVPEIPTMKEQGFAEWELIGMMGLWTTAGTPQARILKVQRAVHDIVRALPSRSSCARASSSRKAARPRSSRTTCNASSPCSSPSRAGWVWHPGEGRAERARTRHGVLPR